jgi:pantoate--beta-alanine ligase
MRPLVVATVAELRAALRPARQAGRTIGFVPTMGALHEGHLSLVRTSRAACDTTVVSIYVNPSQFGPQEDLARYPRTLEADLGLLTGLAEIVFAPSDAEVYRLGHATWVEPSGAAEPLEGAHRPGHFRGVATIVLKLLNMVQPDVAYFGQKDFQQARVIQQMTADLDVPVQIDVCPIVREPDGLALSSRNRYLSPAARRRALVLCQSLEAARGMVAGGQRSAATIRRQMQSIIATADDARVDYIALVDPKSLLPVEQIEGATLAAVAVWIENTRLIDNVVLMP